jgi:hypothetical protein
MGRGAQEVSCKWDREVSDYLTDDGALCRHDDQGDRTYHCTAQRTCSQHVGHDELTCARCISRTRQDIRWIRERAALLPTAALEAALRQGVEAEIVMLAGPAADYGVFSARRAIDRRWLLDNIPERNLERALRVYLDDDDERHPYSVLTRWEFMLREDYGQERKGVTSLVTAANFLERILHRIAQDDEQDFPRFRGEIRDCRQHMETALRTAAWNERGAPCPECVGRGNVSPSQVRLRHEYGHWCMDEDCRQIHYLDDTGDRWVCPREPKRHTWTEKAYRDYVEDRTA